MTQHGSLATERGYCEAAMARQTRRAAEIRRRRDREKLGTVERGAQQDQAPQEIIEGLENQPEGERLSYLYLDDTPDFQIPVTDAVWENLPPQINILPNSVRTYSFAEAFDERSATATGYRVNIARNQDGTGIVPRGLSSIYFEIDVATKVLTVDTTMVEQFGLFYYQIVAEVTENNMPDLIQSGWSQVNVLNVESATFGNVPEKTVYIGQTLSFPYNTFFTQGSPPSVLTVALAKNATGDAIDYVDLAGITASVSGGNIVVDAAAVAVDPTIATPVRSIYYQVTATAVGETPITSPWTRITTRQPIAAVIGDLDTIELHENRRTFHMIADVVTLGDPPLRVSDFIAVLFSGDNMGNTSIHSELAGLGASVLEQSGVLTLEVETIGVDVSNDRTAYIRLRANQRTAAEAQTALNG